MKERRRFFILILIMVAVVSITLTISIWILYSAAYAETKAHLIETAQSQARLIEAVAQFDIEHSQHYSEDPTEATLSQIRQAHENYEGFGETGEFTLAKQVGDEIVFLLRHRHQDLAIPNPVPLDSDLAEPMRQALSGESGTIVGLDYRGEKVIAAYEPVGVLDFGIVSKIDLAEVRAPFLRAGTISGVAALLSIVIGIIAFSRVSNPIIKRLEDYSHELERTVDKRTKELRDAQESLLRQEKLAALGQLAGSVGHELRNPLGVITNAVFYLETVSTEADKKTKEYLDLIQSEAHSATKIVSDLLDFARISPSGKEPSVVLELVTKVISRIPLPENIKFDVSAVSESLAVNVDQGQIRQVLNNLITNAYQAMPDGGKLTIAAREKGNQVDIIVTDTGKGISKKDMENIFEPLFTTKKRGIGLGLAISRNLVEANDGSIKVKSKEGKGSIFTVKLPKTNISS